VRLLLLLLRLADGLQTPAAAAGDREGLLLLLLLLLRLVDHKELAAGRRWRAVESLS
jgi:hypothetical protein